MEFDHRKLLLIIKRDADDCIKKCAKKSCLGDDDCGHLYPPPPHSEAEMARKSLLITGCLVSSVFVLCLAFMIVKRYLSRRRNDAESRRFTERNVPILFDTQEDFVDEDHGPVVDHHVWYINTVGLPQAVIDSISVCEYKRGDGLIEGTECSVCLSEFEEDERVRLLPKCSHAFHVNCIDTWLRSHKNCPLCRAPIVCDGSAAASAAATSSWTSAQEQSSGELASAGDSLTENSESFGGVGVEEEEGESSEARVEDSSIVARSKGGCSRVLGEETPQPMRRSVSMDAISALAIQRAVAAGAVSCHSRSNSQLVKAAAAKGSNLAALSKRVGENLSLYKLMRSSSIGISLQKRPVSMKMSFTSKHRRTQSSIIPI